MHLQLLILLVVFILASITDFLDGKIARKYNLITDFGKFLDPIADKLLATTGLIFLIVGENPIIPNPYGAIFMFIMIPVVLLGTDIKKESLSTDIKVLGLKEKNVVKKRVVEDNKYKFNNLMIEIAPAGRSNVLEKQVGSLAAYGPDCPGCSGRLGSGQNALNGNIYYTDNKYGWTSLRSAEIVCLCSQSCMKHH